MGEYDEDVEFTIMKMTEQEAWELDDLLTRTDPELGPNGTGFLSRKEARLMGMDTLPINYLMTKAEADHKTPAQINRRNDTRTDRRISMSKNIGRDFFAYMVRN